MTGFVARDLAEFNRWGWTGVSSDRILCPPPAEPSPENLLRKHVLRLFCLLAVAFLFQACGAMVGEFFPTAQAPGDLERQIAGTHRR